MNRPKMQQIADAWAALWGAIWWPIWDRVAGGELSPRQAEALATSKIDQRSPVFLAYAEQRIKHPGELRAAWDIAWRTETKAYIGRKVDEMGASFFSNRVILRDPGSASDCN